MATGVSGAIQSLELSSAHPPPQPLGLCLTLGANQWIKQPPSEFQKLPGLHSMFFASEVKDSSHWDWRGGRGLGRRGRCRWSWGVCVGEKHSKAILSWSVGPGAFSPAAAHCPLSPEKHSPLVPSAVQSEAPDCGKGDAKPFHRRQPYIVASVRSAPPG